MLGHYFPLVVFCGLFASLIFSNLHPSKLFLTAVIVLLASGYIETNQILQNGINSGVVTLVLLILSANILERTKVLQRVADRLLNTSFSMSYLRMSVLTILMSSALSNTAVVASFVSVINASARPYARKLLIPLSYCAILGGTLTIVGTSTNLIVNSFWLDKGHSTLDYTVFLKIGIPTAIITSFCLFYLSRNVKEAKAGQQATEDYFVEAKVKSGSALIGKSVAENNLRQLEQLFLVEIYRGNRLISPVAPNENICEGDKLIFSGSVESVGLLQGFDGLALFASPEGALTRNLTKVIVSNKSTLIGRTLKQIEFRTQFDAAVVAIKRDGERISGGLGKVKLIAGDLLVLATGSDFLKRQNVRKNFYLIDKQIAHRYSLNRVQEIFAVVGFISAIVAGIAQLVPFELSLSLFIFCAVVFGLVNTADLKRRFPFELWMLVTSALSIASVIESYYIQQFTQVVFSFDIASPIILLIAIYVLTLILTELVTNNAAAAIAFPIAYSIGQMLGEEYMLASIMAVVFGASASFIFPHSYQTNLIVFNAGNFTNQEFAKTGYKVSVIYSLSVVGMLYFLYG
ncbi:SLC13 family permease [Flocculibacter collagenilyticus]|uniref:SLC13 family permease n=1 Tax=Flocculibacter collagenilyticus TaxID=2744479 RepID=UPI0018F2C3B9|nr:SLC13 family permease [Flocculibacter collagenilyticus]